MIRVIAFRLLQFPLVLAVIYLTTFMLVWVVPGSPFGRTERKLDPIAEQAMKERFHADSWKSFLAYYPIQVITKGDFGRSMQYQEWSVADIIKVSLPVSVTLGIFALTIGTIFGVMIGTLAAVNRGGLFDWLSLTIALIGISIPSFVIAALLLATFTGRLGLFPIGGWGGFREMVLPAVALSLAPLAYIARLTRVSMLDVLGSDFVRTARAKGLSRFTVIWKHCLRNACLPVLSYLGPAAAATFVGSFVVETVFSIPGLGQHFVNSVKNRDQTLILGTVMIYSVFLLTFNLLVDIAYSFVDPRIDITAKASS